MRHSGYGIASFLISLIVIICFLITLFIPLLEKESVRALLLFINFTGIGLGVAGIVHKNHKITLSIIGLILNIAFILTLLISIMFF